MKMQRRLTGVAMLAAVLALAACDESPKEEAEEEAASSEELAAGGGDAADVQGAFEAAEAGCKAAADALGVWTGKPWAEAEETVRGGEGVASIRVIRPGDNVTMDYRTDRLNVELNENGNVTRIYCG